MKPEHNCPRCPHCGDRTGVPQRAWDWNHRAKPSEGHNLACPACGGGWVGTPEEVEQAERAQRAWEKFKRQEDKRAADDHKRIADRLKLARAMAGKW